MVKTDSKRGEKNDSKLQYVDKRTLSYNTWLKQTLSHNTWLNRLSYNTWLKHSKPLLVKTDSKLQYVVKQTLNTIHG